MKKSYSTINSQDKIKSFAVQFLLFLFWPTVLFCQLISDNCQGGRNILPIEDIDLCDGSEWILVFEDNFDGDSLDLSKWGNIGYPGSLQGGTNQNVVTLRNAVVENGILSLIAKQDHTKNIFIVCW